MLKSTSTSLVLLGVLALVVGIFALVWQITMGTQIHRAARTAHAVLDKAGSS